MTANRRSQRTSNLFIVASVIIIMVLGAIGVHFWQKNRTAKKQSIAMLTEMVLMEGRHKTIGPYMKLLYWFKAVEQTEKYYYRYYNRYIAPNEITAAMMRKTDPTQVLKSVRTLFWNNGLLLDSFVPPDTLKNCMYEQFGKYHMYFLTWPETAGYRYQFELSKNKSQYRVTVFETKDHTMDNDSADYWIYDSKTDIIRFYDRENLFTVQERLERYVPSFWSDQNTEQFIN